MPVRLFSADVNDDVKNTIVVSLGTFIFILILSLIFLAIALWGGIVALQRKNVAIGILAIVFAFVFPPMGLILGIVGLIMPSTK